MIAYARSNSFGRRPSARFLASTALALALAGCMRAIPGEMSATLDGSAAANAASPRVAHVQAERQRADAADPAAALRTLSAKGVALDQVGRHEEAQRYYGTALRIVPDEPSVLSNLGLSYALSKDLVRAEATLRRAASQPHADPQVRRNLALIVGLQGRRSEAVSIAAGDLPPEAATADVASLRRMLAEQNGWQLPGQQQLVKAEGG